LCRARAAPDRSIHEYQMILPPRFLNFEMSVDAE
jgi:hypothetical protein